MRDDVIPVRPQFGEAAASALRGKRPWSKPRIKLIDMDFTRAGGPNVPIEGSPGGPPTSAAAYRSS